MQPKIFFVLVTLFIVMLRISAEELSERKSSLYLISSEGDPFCNGLIQVCRQGDWRFSVYKINIGNTIEADCWNIGKNLRPNDNWKILFSPKTNEILEPGFYAKGQKDADIDHPGFSISNRWNFDSIFGKFKILELEYNDEGKIKAFAANLIQHCGRKNSPPLFAGYRFNSYIPVEANIIDIYGSRFTPDSLFCYVLQENATDDNSNLMLLTDRDVKFKYSLQYGNSEGIVISLTKDDEENDEVWKLIFTTESANGFIPDLEEESSYGQNNFSHECQSGVPNMLIKCADNDFYKIGKYKVLEFEQNKYGKLTSLAINFQLEDHDGNINEGAIRYRSKKPVNLESPYKTPRF